MILFVLFVSIILCEDKYQWTESKYSPILEILEGRRNIENECCDKCGSTSEACKWDKCCGTDSVKCYGCPKKKECYKDGDEWGCRGRTETQVYTSIALWGVAGLLFFAGVVCYLCCICICPFAGLFFGIGCIVFCFCGPD